MSTRFSNPKDGFRAGPSDTSRREAGRVGRGFRKSLRVKRPRGFALVAALLLMTLLSVIAIGLLSLGSVSLRSSTNGEARRVAQANARVALALALNELQTQLGDDRRVTADGAVLGESVGQPNLVGVWDSAASNHTENPLDRAPDYSDWKNGLFRGWLVSHPDTNATADRNFAESAPPADAPLLFTEQADGFDLRAPVIPVESDTTSAGAMAWAVSQEGTKAAIGVGGDKARYAANDAIHAPDRPNLGLSKIAKQPEQGWDTRSGKVVSINQAVLDPAYGLDPANEALLGREHSAQSRGLLVDVVNGGLKTDLSLGFELGDSQFTAARWDDIRNPFAGGTAPGGEVPLYKPINSGTTVNLSMNYSPVIHNHVLNTGVAPTFHSLRSHYRMHQHMYSAGGTPTAFFRHQTSPAYQNITAPRGSETSVSPVLDRVLFFMSFFADPQRNLNVVFTPVITLWNPYNVAIESEGFVVYPWMDMPIYIGWYINGGGEQGNHLSVNMGADRTNQNHGRQAEPYFLCKLTATGTENVSRPIRLEPGEVRVFIPSEPTPKEFVRLGSDAQRSLFMKPVDAAGSLDIAGGLRVRMDQRISGAGITHKVQPTDQIRAKIVFSRNQYHYFVSMEDATRIKDSSTFPISRKVPPIAEVQVHSGKLNGQEYQTPTLSGSQMMSKPQPVALLETFHRTAGQTGQLADVVFTVNPRQRYINAMISGSSTFGAGPHYESSMRLVRDYISEAFQVTVDGRRSFYGSSNAPSSGRDYLSFYELPKEPMLSLAGFQHADLSDSAFAPGSQFANAWASPYVSRTTVARLLRNATTPGGERIMPSGLGLYDHSFLVNQALWDGYYFSSIAPDTETGNGVGSPSVYNGNQARIVRSTRDVVQNWVEDPQGSPLRNPRHLLHRGGLSNEDIVERLTSPAGCRHAAAHILVDGAFNVNSTNEAAWAAMLASLRGSTFDVQSDNGSRRSHNPGNSTPVPRLRRPVGVPDDLWNGFRELSDDQIETLASEIVREVRARGPFQSLGEFVNRRIASDETGLKGALQAAIDRSGLNQSATIARFDSSGYPYRTNLPEPFTGIGTPGWLTQADLLNALGPFMTVRSDTFTVRGYGEARDSKGNVTARAWCEAVVQRVPEWTDPEDKVTDLPADLTPASARFGRRFELVSFREVSRQEIESRS